MLSLRLARTRTRALSVLKPSTSFPLRTFRPFSSTEAPDTEAPKADEKKNSKESEEEKILRQMDERRAKLVFDYTAIPPFNPQDIPEPPKPKNWFMRNQKLLAWAAFFIAGSYIFSSMSSPDGVMALISRRKPGFAYSLGMFLLQMGTASGSTSPMIMLHEFGDDFVTAIARHLHPDVDSLDFDRFDEWLKRRVRALIDRDFAIRSLADWAYSKSTEPRLADLLFDLKEEVTGERFKKLTADQKMSIQTAAMILYTTVEQPWLRDRMAKRTDVAMAMYDLAYCPDSQIAAAGLAYLKFMLAYDNIREEFLKEQGFTFLLDIAKQANVHDPTIPSRGPEVAGQAIECLATLGAAMADPNVNLKSFNIPPATKQQDLENILNPLYNGALSMMEQKNYDVAEKISKGALRLDPSNPSFLALLGHCAEGKHDYQLAGTMFDKARQHQPITDVAFPYARLVFNGILQEAKSLSKEERARKALDALYPAFLNSRSFGLQQQRAHEAKTGVKAQLDEIIPKYNESYSLLIDCLETLGRIEEAKKLANEWAVNSPNEAVAHFHFGRLLYQLGETADARRELDRAAVINPIKPEIHYHLALVALAENRLDDAKRHCEQTLKCCEEQEKELEVKFDKRRKVRNRKRRSFDDKGQYGFMSREEREQILSQLDAEEEQDRKTTLAARQKIYYKISGVHLVLGKVYHVEKNFNLALSHYETFLDEKRQVLGDKLSSDPTFIPAALKRVHVLEEAQNLPEAYKQLDEIVGQWKIRCKRAGSCKKYFSSKEEERIVYENLSKTCQAGLSIPELVSLCENYSSLKQLEKSGFRHK